MLKDDRVSFSQYLDSHGKCSVVATTEQVTSQSRTLLSRVRANLGRGLNCKTPCPSLKNVPATLQHAKHMSFIVMSHGSMSYGCCKERPGETATISNSVTMITRLRTALTSAAHQQRSAPESLFMASCAWTGWPDIHNPVRAECLRGRLCGLTQECREVHH